MAEQKAQPTNSYESIVNDMRETNKSTANLASRKIYETFLGNSKDDGTVGDIEGLANKIYDAATAVVKPHLGIEPTNRYGKALLKRQVQGITGLDLEQLVDSLKDIGKVTIEHVEGLSREIRQKTNRGLRSYFGGELENIPKAEEKDYIAYVQKLAKEAGLEKEAGVDYDVPWTKWRANRVLMMALQALDIKEQRALEEKQFQRGVKESLEKGPQE